MNKVIELLRDEHKCTQRHIQNLKELLEIKKEELELKKAEILELTSNIEEEIEIEKSIKKAIKHLNKVD